MLSFVGDVSFNTNHHFISVTSQWGRYTVHPDMSFHIHVHGWIPMFVPRPQWTKKHVVVISHNVSILYVVATYIIPSTYIYIYTIIYPYFLWSVHRISRFVPGTNVQRLRLRLQKCYQLRGWRVAWRCIGEEVTGLASQGELRFQVCGLCNNLTLLKHHDSRHIFAGIILCLSCLVLYVLSIFLGGKTKVWLKRDEHHPNIQENISCLRV